MEEPLRIIFARWARYCNDRVYRTGQQPTIQLCLSAKDPWVYDVQQSLSVRLYPDSLEKGTLNPPLEHAQFTLISQTAESFLEEEEQPYSVDYIHNPIGGLGYEVTIHCDSDTDPHAVHKKRAVALLDAIDQYIQHGINWDKVWPLAHQLRGELHPEDVEQLRKSNGTNLSGLYHHSMGRSLRNHLKLWNEENRRIFNNADADRCSSILIESMWEIIQKETWENERKHSTTTNQALSKRS